MRAPGNTRLTPRVEAERRRVQDHPLVKATMEAEREIRARYAKKDWPVAIQAATALLGLEKGLVFADRVNFGLRSRMHLLNDAWCVQCASGGCQCKLELGHAPPHVCYCGRTFTQAEAFHGRRGYRVREA